ncbi:unnamed protein product [Danaus chrysippus]|uniref:(African queen) hypothetical protein n=1 Tax=Danaus chrysippus TaxID=151541 RepID=A0A8J2VYG4_9NEOP|nr:unnamed protein product [Danaus chrysippus]
MAKFTVFVAVALLVMQVYTRDIRSNTPSAGNSKKNITSYIKYNELVYILETRHGNPAKKPTRLTPCARAILSCCEEKVINEGCSESLKCGAYFFDDNPCEDKFIIDALEAAKLFYQQLVD